MLARTTGPSGRVTPKAPLLILLRTGRFVGPVKLYSLLPHGHYFVLRP
jgi:hypothetical protein